MIELAFISLALMVACLVLGIFVTYLHNEVESLRYRHDLLYDQTWKAIDGIRKDVALMRKEHENTPE